MTTGRDLYEARWWAARMRGIVLRPWPELEAKTRRVWDERAATGAADAGR